MQSNPSRYKAHTKLPHLVIVQFRMLHEYPNDERSQLVHENHPVIIIYSGREALEGTIDIEHHLLVILVAFDLV